MSNHEYIQTVDSKIQGRGVIATKNFKKGELVCIMQGEEIAITKLRQRQADKDVRVDDPYQVSYSRYMLLSHPYIFINHSCNPNIFGYRSRRMTAIRDIKEGEEIAYDYSAHEWTNDALWKINWEELWRMEGNCGEKNCRAVIRTFPNLPMEVKLYYYANGFLPDYILHKFKLEHPEIARS
jgi:SET domain-containing protein